MKDTDMLKALDGALSALAPAASDCSIDSPVDPDIWIVWCNLSTAYNRIDKRIQKEDEKPTCVIALDAQLRATEYKVTLMARSAKYHADRRHELASRLVECMSLLLIPETSRSVVFDKLRVEAEVLRGGDDDRP